jgi:hypothetical protein
MLASTGIQTSIVTERLFAGESTASAAKDFGIREIDIEDATRFEPLQLAA